MRAKFDIPIKEIEAIKTLRSKDESRHVLNGVLFEITGNSVILVATDGRKMGILKSSATAIDSPNPVSVVVPCIMSSRLPKTKDGVVTVSVNETKCHFENKHGETSEKVIEANFPVWRHVVPKSEFKPCRITLNSRYVTDFERCATVLRPSAPYVSLVPHGDELQPVTVLIESAPDFYGIIMPARSNAPEVPDWLKETTK